MKVLFEARAAAPIALVLDDVYGDSVETFAAQEAVARTLDGREFRAGFDDHELEVLHGLSEALHSGAHDTRHGDANRIIRGDTAELLLDALRFYVRMPAEEKESLSELGESKLDNATVALANLTHVFLLPGAGKTKIISEIVPAHISPQIETDIATASDSYDWLYEPSAVQVTRYTESEHYPLHVDQVVAPLDQRYNWTEDTQGDPRLQTIDSEAPNDATVAWPAPIIVKQL